MVDLPLEVDRQKRRELRRGIFLDAFKDLIDAKYKCELLYLKILDNLLPGIFLVRVNNEFCELLYQSNFYSLDMISPNKNLVYPRSSFVGLYRQGLYRIRIPLKTSVSSDNRSKDKKKIIIQFENSQMLYNGLMTWGWGLYTRFLVSFVDNDSWR